MAALPLDILPLLSENATGWSITDSSAVYVGASNISLGASSVESVMKTELQFEGSVTISDKSCGYSSGAISSSNTTINADVMTTTVQFSLGYWDSSFTHYNIVATISAAYYKSDWVRSWL